MHETDPNNRPAHGAAADANRPGDLEEIDALQREGDPDAAHKLRLIAENAADKATRKAAKRALYNLKTAGVVPPEAPALTAAPVRADTLRAFASAYDGAGNRLLFLALPDPDGGKPTLLQYLLNDEQGVQSFEAARMARAEVDARIERFEEQLEGGLALAEIEGDYGRKLLADAHALTRRLGRTSPHGFLDWLPRVGAPRSEHSGAPVWQEIPPESVQADTELDRDPGALFTLPWFDAWFFAANDVYRWIDRARFSPNVDPTALSEEDVARREGLLTEAVIALMGGEMRQRYTGRLEETADILRRRGRDAAARQALFHALELASETPIETSPFARGVVRRTIEAAEDIVRARNAASGDPNA